MDAKGAGNVQRKSKMWAYVLFLICEELRDEQERLVFGKDAMLSLCASRISGGNKEHLICLGAISRSYTLTQIQAPAAVVWPLFSQPSLG